MNSKIQVSGQIIYENFMQLFLLFQIYCDIYYLIIKFLWKGRCCSKDLMIEYYKIFS